MSTIPPVTGPRAGAKLDRRGVLFVHGIGSQRQSDFLLDVGEPLVDWLTQWHAAHDNHAPRVTGAELHFAATDDGATTSYSIVTLPSGEEWVLAEAWWAASTRRQRFAEMAIWTVKHLGQAAYALWRSIGQRLSGREKDAASIGPVARRILALYLVGALLLYSVAIVLGLPLILLALFLAQLPIPTVQQFLLRLLQPFLEINLGEFRSIVEDEIQAANIRRRIAETVDKLVTACHCRDVTIVAHSGGAVVSLDMLTDDRYRDAAAHVRKLLTLGSGLNKAWLVAPADLRRLRQPLKGRIHWVDFWTSFDPAPSGWLRPPAGPDGRPLIVFAPDDRVVRAQGLVTRDDPNPFPPLNAATPAPRGYWPVSVKVTNELSVLTDHGAYWRNDEEVLARLAAEIDSEYYRESRYWRGRSAVTYSEQERRDLPLYAAPAERTLREQITRRRGRVIRLAAYRALAIIAWLVTILLAAAPVARWVREHGGLIPLPGWFTQALPEWLAAPTRYLIAALIVGIPWLFLFRAVRYFWERGDARRRRAAIAAIARAADVPPAVAATGGTAAPPQPLPPPATAARAPAATEQVGALGQPAPPNNRQPTDGEW